MLAPIRAHNNSSRRPFFPLSESWGVSSPAFSRVLSCPAKTCPALRVYQRTSNLPLDKKTKPDKVTLPVGIVRAELYQLPKCVSDLRGYVPPLLRKSESSPALAGFNPAFRAGLGDPGFRRGDDVGCWGSP